MSNRTIVAALLVTILLCSLAVPAATSGLGSDAIPHRPPPEEIVLPAVADAATNADQPNTNYGDSATLVVGHTALLRSDNARTYIGFDVTGIPASIEIVSAELELYLTLWEGIGPFEINASTPMGSWSESLITWNNQPDVDHLLDKNSVPAAEGYQSWDVTDAVDGWITRRLFNHGLVLWSSQGSFRAAFNSKESRSIYQPRLVISYYGTIPTATVTPTATRTIPVKPPTATPTRTNTIPVKPPTATPTRTKTLPVKPPTSTPSITPTPHRIHLPLVVKQIPVV